MFVFWKIWCALFSWNTHFEIRFFALSPTISQIKLSFINLLNKSYFGVKNFFEKLLETYDRLWNNFFCTQIFKAQPQIPKNEVLKSIFHVIKYARFPVLWSISWRTYFENWQWTTNVWTKQFGILQIKRCV